MLDCDIPHLFDFTSFTKVLHILGLNTVKPLFNESLGDWFFLHKIEVFTKWGLCKVTSKTLFFFTHILTVQFYMISLNW
jgi:hypothetical protein